MVATAKRIAGEGYEVMPHFPARIIKDKATLREWIAMYQGEAGVDQALLLAGGVTAPHGDYESSMQLLESDAFGDTGFKRLHVAGHPEGNKDIDPNGSVTNVEATRCDGNKPLVRHLTPKWPLQRNFASKQIL